MPDPFEVIDIDDPDDPRVAPYRSVRDATIRDEMGCFVAEGPDVLRDACATGLEVISALIDARRPPTEHLPSAVTVLRASPSVIGTVTGLGVHRGVLALVHRPPERTAEEVTRHATTLVVLERVENPVNVGLIARSAVALGADGMLLDPTTADPLYRRSVTASRAAVLRLPWARIERVDDSVRILGDHGWLSIALTPDEAAPDLRELVPGDRRVAIVLGSEGPGLTTTSLAACTTAARIPMRRGVDSLNVATAAAIALWAVADRHVRPR